VKIALIDHYDSFSFNVLDWLKGAASPSLEFVRIVCDDQIGLTKLKKNPIPIVISPGPGSPAQYPLTCDVLFECMQKVPILGICLGHQMLGYISGAKIIRAKDPWHGTQQDIRISEKNWFTKDLDERILVTLYNSLVIDHLTLDDAQWNPCAFDSLNQLMMMIHNKNSIASVQFHPESFSSSDLTILAKNFMSTF
jgi:anthranilate synthase/aminodeoxychorismate synthase-like glutamine amidotransferase